MSESIVRGTWRDGWYVVPYQVIFRDVDAFGHVNNAVYFTYFEWARTLLWFEINGFGGPTDIGFIVAHAECDFRKQIGLESIEICIRVGQLRNTSFDTDYEIRRNGGAEIAATGKVTVVLFDWTTNAKKPIDDELRKKIERASLDQN
ncbi:MAG TPA: thioesterase family protein [Thermoanaerobaculia bacterium]